MAKEYTVLTSRLDEAAEAFFGRVGDLLRQGWTCQGGVSVAVVHPTSDMSPAIAGSTASNGRFSATLRSVLVYSQAMVK